MLYMLYEVSACVCRCQVQYATVWSIECPRVCTVCSDFIAYSTSKVCRGPDWYFKQFFAYDGIGKTTVAGSSWG